MVERMEISKESCTNQQKLLNQEITYIAPVGIIYIFTNTLGTLKSLLDTAKNNSVKNVYKVKNAHRT